LEHIEIDDDEPRPTESLNDVYERMDLEPSGPTLPAVLSPYVDLEVPGDLSDDETRVSTHHDSEVNGGNARTVESKEELPFIEPKKVRIMEAEDQNPKDLNPASDSDTRSRSSMSTGSYSSSYSGSSYTGSSSGMDSSKSYTSRSEDSTDSEYSGGYTRNPSSSPLLGSDEADMENQMPRKTDELSYNPPLDAFNKNLSEVPTERVLKRFSLENIASLMRNSKTLEEPLLQVEQGDEHDVELGASSSDDDERIPAKTLLSTNRKYSALNLSIDTFSDEFDEENQDKSSQKAVGILQLALVEWLEIMDDIDCGTRPDCIDHTWRNTLEHNGPHSNIDSHSSSIPSI
jgi:hypothetical protein